MLYRKAFHDTHTQRLRKKKISPKKQNIHRLMLQRRQVKRQPFLDVLFFKPQSFCNRYPTKGLALIKEVAMTDRDSLNSNGDVEDGKVVNHTEEGCSEFCVESEEVLDEKERDRRRRAARKYETLVDRLFDDDDGQDETEKI